MRTFHEGCVKRNDVHEHAETEPALKQTPEDSPFHQRDFGVQEQFHRVVAGLAMDVHATGEIGRDRVVQPVIVGEPGAFGGDGDQVARARMVQAEFLFFLRAQDGFDAGLAGEEVARGGFERRVVEIDVGDLVVRDGEDLAGADGKVLDCRDYLHFVSKNNGVTMVYEKEVQRLHDASD